MQLSVRMLSTKGCSKSDSNYFV